MRLRQGAFSAVTDYGDDPAAVAVRWQAAGAQRIHVVDLDAARTGRTTPENRAAVRAILAAVSIPVQMGGGLRTLEAAEAALEMGIDRLVFGTVLARDPAFAAEALGRYGEHAAAGIDARDGRVAVQGWQEVTGEDAVAFARRMAALGACRIIFTDISRDGMLVGVNHAALRTIVDAVDTPVIASGGVAGMDDIVALIGPGAPPVDGVIIGKALYAGRLDLAEAIRVAGAGC